MSCKSALSILPCSYANSLDSMTRQNGLDLSSMTAAWLLPIVSCVVAASSGAIVADILPKPGLAVATILASYVLWGIGVPLAMMII